MVKITINGEVHEFPEGTMLIDAARSLGIKVPTLCHDERMKPTSACRMCVMDVGGRLMTSCSTVIWEGMVVETDNSKVKKSRRDVVDLLFSNHPNDCLTCEATGDCKLQEYCYEYGVKEGSYRSENNKNYKIDRKTSQFLNYDPNKCILCGKCVAMCSEIQKSHALTIQNRGFESKMATPFEIGFDESTCVSCGNCASVCPTGALRPKKKKPYRPWEVKKTRTTCPYCAVGCQLNLITKGNEVVGAEPYKGEYMTETSNGGILCVKGRFAYNFINNKDRLRTPLIKNADGEFEEATWDEALSLIAEKLGGIKEEFGPEYIAGFSCARATNEDNYVMQKFMRAAIGTNNVDHCARV